MAGLVETDLVTPASPAVGYVVSSDADVMQRTLPTDSEDVVRRPPGVHRAQPRPYRRRILAVGLGVLAAATLMAVLPNDRPSALWKSSSSGLGQLEPTFGESATARPTPAGAGMDVATRSSTPSPNPTSRRPVTVAPEPGLLGGLDVSRYCKSHGPGVAKPAGPRTGPGAAFAPWQCTHGRQATPVTMDDVCRWQYGSSTAYAKPADPNDASSWACFA